MKAVVCTGIGKYSVEEVRLDAPKAGEIKVKIGATGVCHSDLSVINGVLPLPPPIVLGHEGAGIVRELGPGVTRFQVGDHVVLSFVPCCGRCNDCLKLRPVYCTAGQPNGKMLDGTSRVHIGDTDLGVMQFLGCMAEEAVVPESEAKQLRAQVRELQRLLGKKTMEAEILREALDLSRSKKLFLRSNLPEPGDGE